ncbi:MAG: DNA polymerase III subunit [Candidatus Saccharicenans sp.]|uniref:DNA polymerase III subunit n=1 Tax=Candidatus Saccharicenans sp. TaxID=2819258 RepID=UPI004049E887
MSFKDVPGNEQVKQILRLSLSKGRLPNSLLLAGPAGSGKLKTALTVAKALNCLEKIDDSCDRCDSCVRVERGQHPNVRVISREKNREQIVKEQIEEINYLAKLRPWNQGRLVFIVDEADRMNETVANSLLKTLEEPRAFAYFILVTEELQLILPTIRSRCQVLRFNPLGQVEVEKALLDRGLPAEKARLLAAASDGNLEAVLDMTWEEFIAGRNQAWLIFKQLLESAGAEDFLSLVTGRSRKDSLSDFREVLKFFSVFFRDLLVVHKGQEQYLLNPDLWPELDKLSGLVPAGKAASAVTLVEDYLSRLKKNPNLAIISNELVIFFREIRNA